MSTVVHMLLLIIMGLLTIAPSNQGSREIELDVLGEGLGDELLDASVEIGEPTLEPAQKAPRPTSMCPISPSRCCRRQPQWPPAAPWPSAICPRRRSVMRSQGAMRAARAFCWASTVETRTPKKPCCGLAWLKRNQRPDGSWSLLGPYEDGAISENTVAATAMASWPFRGRATRINRVIIKPWCKKGWNYLLRMQDSQGSFANKGVPPMQHFYAHGQATIAVCEAYGMTRDPRLLPAAERAVGTCE